MKLLVEPEGGIAPILNAIKHARKTIEILIFRLDCRSVTRSLEAAVGRGVVVRVIIASKHRGGTRDLRKLELRLLDAGAVVSRTADDLQRYHAKMMIVDWRLLHVYGFNYTRLDYKSRSFGILTTNRTLVREALKLFDADGTRRAYSSGSRDFVVSPENARERLSAFIRGARRELLSIRSAIERRSDPSAAHGTCERGSRCTNHRQDPAPRVHAQDREIPGTPPSRASDRSRWTSRIRRQPEPRKSGARRSPRTRRHRERCQSRPGAPVDLRTRLAQDTGRPGGRRGHCRPKMEATIARVKVLLLGRPR